jgi:hypothetical protein
MSDASSIMSCSISASASLKPATMGTRGAGAEDLDAGAGGAMPADVRGVLGAEDQAVARRLAEGHAGGDALVALHVVGEERRVLLEAGGAGAEEELAGGGVLEGGAPVLVGDLDPHARRPDTDRGGPA